MDLLTLTVLAGQQPRRAVQFSAESSVHWCARCFADFVADTADANLYLAHLPFASFRVPECCVRCCRHLDYNDL